MTPRTFFALFIKILGIYLVLDSVTIVPEFIFTTISTFTMRDSDTWQGMVITVFLLLLLMATYYFILRFCIFKTDWIIDKLKLDAGFAEEKLELDIHRSTVLRIAVIVMGGLIFIDAFPLFCKEFFNFISFKETVGKLGQTQKTDWIILYLVKMLLGYFLMVNSIIVVSFVERKGS